MNVFSGTWQANLEKSRRHANHQFQNATLVFEIDGENVTLKQSGINHDGKYEQSTLMLIADGVEREVSPHAPGVLVRTAWNGSNILETQATKDGKMMGKGTYEVSDDGSTLTATVGGIDGGGREFEQVIVFDRVAAT